MPLHRVCLINLRLVNDLILILDTLLALREIHDLENCVTAILCYAPKFFFETIHCTLYNLKSRECCKKTQKSSEIALIINTTTNQKMYPPPFPPKNLKILVRHLRHHNFLFSGGLFFGHIYFGELSLKC